MRADREGKSTNKCDGWKRKADKKADIHTIAIEGGLVEKKKMKLNRVGKNREGEMNLVPQA